MEEKIIQRLYFKIVLAGTAGALLCIVASFLAGTWSTLWFGGFVLIGVTFTALSIRRDVKRGHVVSVYAECYESIGGKSFVKQVANSRITYRFITKSVNPILFDEDDDDDAAISLYIKGERGKFREGELYCLLFRKALNNAYNEQNLLTYGAVQPDIMSFAADDGIDGQIAVQKTAQDKLSDEDIHDLEDNKKLVIFRPKHEDI